MTKTIRGDTTTALPSARHVSSISEKCIAYCYKLISNSMSAFCSMYTSRMIGDELACLRSRRLGSVFWTSSTAISLSAILALAVLTGQSWILHGISVLIIDQILFILIKWIVYTLDDRELRFACHAVRTWLSLIIQEGEEVLTSQSAAKYIMAVSILQSAPTGVSYARWIIRYKMKSARSEFLRENVGKDRLSLKRNRLALAAIARAKLIQNKVYNNVNASRETMKRRNLTGTDSRLFQPS